MNQCESCGAQADELYTVMGGAVNSGRDIAGARICYVCRGAAETTLQWATLYQQIRARRALAASTPVDPPYASKLCTEATTVEPTPTLGEFERRVQQCVKLPPGYRAITDSFGARAAEESMTFVAFFLDERGKEVTTLHTRIENVRGLGQSFDRVSAKLAAHFVDSRA